MGCPPLPSVIAADGDRGARGLHDDGSQRRRFGAQPVTQEGLVNVNLTDVTVQVPIALSVPARSLTRPSERSAMSWMMP